MAAVNSLAEWKLYDCEGQPVYKKIYQGNMTNVLFFLKDKQIKKSLQVFLNRNLDSGKLDLGMPVRKTSYNNVRYWIIPGLLNLKGRTKQMYDFIIEKFTEKVPVGASLDIINRNKDVEIDLNEVAYYFTVSLRGARDIALEAISTLMNIKLERLDIVDKEKLNDPDDIKLRIFPAINELVLYRNGKVVKNNRLTVSLHPRLIEYLPKAGVMPLNQCLFSLDTGTYSNSYVFGRFMHLHYNRNRDNKDDPDLKHILKVITLLDAASEIPSYEEVMESSKHVYKLIIYPFFRDMNYLVERKIVSNWYFIKPKTGETKTREKIDFDVNSINDIKNLKWKDFETYNVYFELSNYPQELPLFNPDMIEPEEIEDELDDYVVEELII